MAASMHRRAWSRRACCGAMASTCYCLISTKPANWLSTTATQRSEWTSIEDVEGVWDRLVAEKGFGREQIGISANSLGSAAALYAFTDEPRMAAVDVLHAPIANLPQVIREELRRVGYPSWLAPSGIIMARLPVNWCQHCCAAHSPRSNALARAPSLSFTVPTINGW